MKNFLHTHWTLFDSLMMVACGMAGITLLFLILIFTTSCTDPYLFHFSNDILSRGKNNDKNYTQGAQLDRITPDDTGSSKIYIGQNIYTPGGKQKIDPQPNDRPYAGYDANYLRGPDIQDTFGITTGIVGPHAYGEQVQNGFHRLIGDRTAKGWDNQIHDEFGIMGKAERDVRYPINNNLDFTTIVGGNLGNVFTQGYGGGNLRFGHNLPSSFYNTIIFPRGEYTNAPNLLSYYLFAGPWGRLVARNIFLDGNTFRDSASIDKQWAVIEGRIGVAVEYGKYKFAYTFIDQSSEYKGGGGAGFGEITLGAAW